MIAKVLEYIEVKIQNAYFLIGVFVLVFLCAWLANGLLQTKLDLNALQTFFWAIVGKFGFDSIFNSEKNQKP